ncbi:PQQ-dependent sugar dehydrogenase [Halobacillus litoralis]|uniref:PQQ-dependent sugar dehydrogenase n=1 Tax=Halobacillus litoralis TaxID=45668 RepID=UPI002490F410|nr:PQQ-dependent sugar dehydrogenase [Halobacillus litoralis]
MKYAGYLLLVVLLVSCSEEPPQEKAELKGERFQTVESNLETPWNIEHDENVFYITERPGNIVSWSNGDDPERLPVETEKEILQNGEGGLLGFTLNPERKGEAIIYHTYQEEGVIKNRVVLIEKGESQWREKGVLLEGIPGAPYHNGGRIEIGPDGKLYITTGDASEENLGQKRESLAGKILRMNIDGTVPEDNPVQGSFLYSYGHRNSQGLTWNSEGDLFSSEHGPNNHDEINKIEAGKNYGWPTIVGEEKNEGMMAPLYQTGDRTWAPSGLSAFDGELYVATLRGEALRRISQQGEDPEIITDRFGRIRDVEVIEGEIYFITNNTDGRGNADEKDDRLIRFSPE